VIPGTDPHFPGGEDEDNCPILALENGRAAAKIDTGPLLRVMNRRGQVLSAKEPSDDLSTSPHSGLYALYSRGPRSGLGLSRDHQMPRVFPIAAKLKPWRKPTYWLRGGSGGSTSIFAYSMTLSRLLDTSNCLWSGGEHIRCMRPEKTRSPR
jgi:hypothetical protein